MKYMRIIKFRGKLSKKQNGKKVGDFVYGYLFEKQINKARVFYIKEFDGENYFDNEVWSHSVEQFTERYDKNKKEIYDNDVLKDNVGLGRVTWSFVENGWVVVDDYKKKHRLTGEGEFILKNTEIVDKS